jgi:hypothetical protein
MCDRLASLKDALHARFLRLCENDLLTGCWIWTGAWQETSGLGVIRVRGRLYTAHRVALWVYRGGFRLEDTTRRVYHSACDVPACCAPEHLRLASSPAAVNRALRRLGRFSSRVAC